MFGIMEAMLSFIRRQIGLRTDAASGSGSIHAKIGDLKNTINTVDGNVFPWHKKTSTFSRGAISSISNGQTLTILEITGNRVISSGEIRVALRPGAQIEIKITIDGAEILPPSTQLLVFASPLNGYCSPQYDPVGAETYGVMSLRNLHFSTSFKIEVINNDVATDYQVSAGIWHVPA